MTFSDVGTDPSGGGSARILIVGLGNGLMSDDGIGPAVVGRLGGDGLPTRVRTEVLPGDILGLVDLWNGEPEVWIVDAVTGGAGVGEIFELDHESLLASPAGRDSAHQLTLSENLRWLLHSRPEMSSIRFRLVGGEVGDVGPGMGLSSAARELADRLAGKLRTEASA